MPYIRLSTAALRGHFHFDYTPEERCIWYELLLLSRDLLYPGYLQQSEIKGYPLSYIASQIGISGIKLQKVMVKLKADKSIEVNSYGCIKIVNWDKWQPKYNKHELSQFSASNHKPKSQLTDGIIDPNLSSMCKSYEQELGIMLTPGALDTLKALQDEYPEGWFELACKEAVLQNKRNLKYVMAILKHWQVDGISSGNARSSKEYAGPRMMKYED